MVVFWFRRDLRWEDNIGLFHALNAQHPVLPIFIFDENILKHLEKNDPRLNFIYDTLAVLHKKLLTFQSSLATFYGHPLDIFKKLVEENNIKAVYTNKDYEPYALKRDESIETFLNSKEIAFHAFKDQVIFEQNEITKDGSSPYVVYTPYSKKWLEKLSSSMLDDVHSDNVLYNMAKHEYPFLSLEDVGFKTSAIQVPSFQIEDEIIANYSQTRNFPALEKTSYLGTHLRFGTVSIRRVVKRSLKAKDNTFLKELIWREFFMQILWHFPHTTHKSFKPEYDQILWRNNEQEFWAWCEGKTGYPFVDAGMRELNATGLMSNRSRLIVASFLCKHLLIDWRWGESYFAQKLLDFDQSSNVGNWQWSAGTGVDAAPYFRIFNPQEQVLKFDPEYQYIKKWVKELGTLEYPQPIVEHRFARERCLSVYKAARVL